MFTVPTVLRKWSKFLPYFATSNISSRAITDRVLSWGVVVLFVVMMVYVAFFFLGQLMLLQLLAHPHAAMHVLVMGGSCNSVKRIHREVAKIECFAEDGDCL